MKTMTVLFVGTLAMVLTTGPGLAQTTSNYGSTTSSPAETPSKLSIPHRVTGAVVAAIRAQAP